MNAGKELESAQNKKPEPADRVTNANNLMELERMRRKGGYVVATAGLSGYAFFVGIKLFGFLVSGIIWGAIITAGIIWDGNRTNGRAEFVGRGGTARITDHRKERKVCNPR